jgi:hypothetical protein
MFSFSNMVHFFAHEFSRLGAGGFAFALVFTCPFNWFFFWHIKIVSPLVGRLDVTQAVTACQVSARRRRSNPIGKRSGFPGVAQISDAIMGGLDVCVLTRNKLVQGLR